jgi:hypothetical protein
VGSKTSRTGGNAGGKGARRLVTGLLIASPLAWANAAHAGTITANFSRGAIAEYTNNPNGTDKGVLFSTLGISSMSISQISANGQWGGTQGNDTSVTATINFTNGTSATFPAAINWVKNAGSGQFDWIGITIGSATTVNDGYALDSGFQKTYILEFPQSSLALSTLLPNGLDGSANTGQALSALNQYFPTATPPVITGPSGGAGAASSSISVNENQTAVTTLTADKAVTWSITGGTDSSRFAISPSGVITFTAAPDFEAPADSDNNNSYVLTVTATDSNGNTATQAITVTVLDLDDTAPVVAAGQSFSYAENQSASAIVGTVAATDAAGVTGFRFSATGTQTSADGYYVIDNSGVLRITAAGAAAGVASNDYEVAPNSFTHGVQARDSAGNWSAAVNVTLNVTDADDTAPLLPAGQSFAYAENRSANAAVGTVSASDATGVTQFRFAGTGTQTSADGYYTIDNSGVLRITAAGVAAGVPNNDFEQAPNSFTYAVQAGDAAGNWSAATNISLDVTDLPDTAPVITGPSGGAGAPSSAISINENQTSVTTLTADKAVTWAIAGGTDSGKFSISPSGVITFNAAPDYEAPTDSDTDNSYVLTVSATDSNGNVATQTVTVTVLDLDDSAPLIAAGQSFSYAENRSANAIIGTVAASDAAGITAFRFVATGTQTSADGYYTVDGSGVLRITGAGAAAGVANNDYETAPNSFTYGLQASDAAGNWSAATDVTLNVTDLADTPPAITGPSGGPGAASSSISVNEGTSSVTTLTSNVPVTWSIAGGNDQGRFQISPSGAITFVAAPDYENPTDSDTNNNYVLTVQAADSNGNVSTQTVTVTVLDLPDIPPAITGPSGGPGAANSSVSVNEGTSSVTTLTSNVPVTWSIVGGNDQGRFQISPSGAITFVAAPDYENPSDSDTNNSYVLTVAATDSNGNVSTQTVTVTVLDLPDIPPAITGPSGGPGAATSSINVNEGTTAVTTLTSNVPVTWSIVGGNDQGRFEVSPSGAITFVSPPDYEAPADSDTNNLYVLTVQAVDANGNASTQTVTVTVLDRPDTPPSITGPTGGAGAATSSISVNEGSTAVTTLTSNVPVTWTVTGGTDASRFAISPMGEITFVGAPLYDKPTDSNADNIYVLTVSAADANGNVSVQTIMVTVLNVDSTAPVVGAAQTFSYAENRAANAVVATVAASDGAGVTEFRFASTGTQTSADGYYTIDNAGLVRITSAGAAAGVANNDFEIAPNSFTYAVQAGDAAGNWSAAANLVLNVTDLADTAPVITGPSGAPGAAASAISVNEGTTAITTLTSNAPVTWSIVGGNDQGQFQVTSDGAIIFVAAPDYESPSDSDRNNIYVLTVQAADAGGNKSTQTISVTVLNVDELQRKLNEIGSRLRQNLRDHAFGSLSSMLAFNEGLIGISNPVCSADRGKPLSGRLNGDDNRQDAGLNFRRDLTSCRSRTRLYVDGGLGFTRVHKNWTARGLAALRIEQLVGSHVALGAALLGSTASDELQAFSDGRISDRSLQLNLYGRAQLSDRLRLGAFAGWGRVHYSLRLEDGGLELGGEMDGTRYLYGAALSGDIPLGPLTLTTDAILSRAVERLHSATLKASYGGERRSGISFAVGTVDITRLSVPVHIPITLSGGHDGEDGARLDFSPGMLCEDISADSSSLHCGYQVGLKFRMSPTWRTGIHGEARQEVVDGYAMRLLSLGFMRMFGPAERYSVAVDAERRARSRQSDDRLMLRIGLR